MVRILLDGRGMGGIGLGQWDASVDVSVDVSADVSADVSVAQVKGIGESEPDGRVGSDGTGGTHASSRERRCPR
jgi:hypothetical protein